jgi:hypothetical protein
MQMDAASDAKVASINRAIISVFAGRRSQTMPHRNKNALLRTAAPRAGWKLLLYFQHYAIHGAQARLSRPSRCERYP